MAHYYDLVLGLIPVALLGGAGLLVAAGVSLTFAVPTAAMFCAGLIGHAMFVNAPVDTTASNGSNRPPMNSAD